MYEGSWFNDLRHGKGRQEYPNKDIYDGSWEQNMVSCELLSTASNIHVHVARPGLCTAFSFTFE